MTTNTAAGSRPGGAIAGAWAVMNYLGVAGYEEKAKMIVDAQTRIEEGMKQIGDYRTLHSNRFAITTIASDTLDIFGTWKSMAAKGWYTSAILEPMALQLMVQPYHVEVMDQFLADMQETAKQLREGGGDTPSEQPRYN
jgi:glutamate/tyrosine decarboxylase-like PLP-dependent enzyme